MRNPTCKLCDLYKTAQKICIQGEGPKPSEIMVIGEAPRYRREIENIDKPFSGKSGRILDIVLNELGIDREEIYITNALHCGIPEKNIPKMDQIRACREYLLDEIKEVNPKIIICLGSISLKGLYDSNLMSITKERGRILDFQYEVTNSSGRNISRSCKVIPSYHPAAALYNKYIANILHSDLKDGIERARNSSSVKVKEENKYTLAKNEDVEKLYNAKEISVDVETTGLDYMDQKLELVTVNMSIKPHESFIFERKQLDLVKKILSNKELVINHNIKFDIEWLNRYDIHIKSKIFDTMVAKHLLDENYPDKELKHLARVELNMLELSEEEKVMIQHRKNGTQPTLEELRRYGGGDSDATLRLYHNYKEGLKREGLEKLMETEMKVLKTLAKMEIFGFKIDKKEHSRLCTEYKEKIDESSNTIKKLVGDINLNSSNQLRDLFYDKLDFPVLRKTEKGAPSCNEQALQELMLISKTDKQKNILTKFLEYRNLSKLYTTYLLGLEENELLKHDGKIHCDFKICGTKTGRLSCSDPNLENIPRDGSIKNMFISSFTKGKIIQVDYSQMELRILAHYSGDKALINAFKTGRDIHRETTSKCLNKPYDKVTEDERKIIGKRVNFGIVYCIGAKGLSERINCTVPEAEEFIRNYFREFSGVKRWMEERKEEVIGTGKSISFNGRIRRLYGASNNTPEGREALRQGVNSPIQGGAGDITKYNMMRLDRRLRKLGLQARVNNNVHDSVMVDSPEKEVKECIKQINELFVEPPLPLSVPLAFDIKYGNSWGSLKGE